MEKSFIIDVWNGHQYTFESNTVNWFMPLILTHFSLIFHFYNPWKKQKDFDFLTFAGGKER